MAEQSVHDVVNQTLSVGDRSPSDADVDNSNRHATGGELAAGATRADNRGNERSEQDSTTIQAGETSYAHTNGQAHNEIVGVQSSLVETETSTGGNIHDSDFDGNMSRNPSVGDLSTASDNDAPKAEQSSASEDTKNQDAGNAARMKAPFKSVSYAKYSAAKAAGANSAAKPTSDKALSSPANSSTTSLQPGSRPRLVAKTTSGVRDNGLKMSKPGGRNGAGGPDPMQVWNKNRPAQPTSTKHLTDEELKQQYGIHMTSRIEADGESKEAKWADIDDDEDDWAPETIEWADGTKVTLNHANNLPLPQEAMTLEKPPGEQQPKESQPARPKASQVTSSIGPNATVLKLGASAERQQAQKAVILQKGPSERPASSAAKSPAPVPAKSPWAPLPPVEKVSPININPHVPMFPPNRLNQASATGLSPSTAIALSPAKEISADDFNRSWRDSQPTQPRELFMPNSGRYEAVNENRRRSSKNEPNFRAPALLQRPTPGDQYAPAEPSPAFQTSRVSVDQERGSWNRRRASSIQSGGSGQLGRRMSISKGSDAPRLPTEMSQHQTASSQAGVTDVVTSLRGVHVQPNANQPSTPSTAGPPGQSADMALVANQKRLMQESARSAVQRRREEELKEEAARKERIRLKLEQLGPLPDQKTKPREQKADTSPKLEDSLVQVSSPPKPPVPEATGEPKQYGMMKVHHPDNVRKFGPQADKPDNMSETQNVASSSPEPVKSPAPIANVVQAAGDPPIDRAITEPQDNLVASEEDIQSWKSNQASNDTLPGWNRGNHYPSSASCSLWGPPNQDKALGNGTFDQSLTGLPARDLSVRNTTQQQNWLNGRPSSHDRSPQLPPIRSIPPENVQSVVSFPSPEQRPIAANSEADSLQPIGKPSPIGPPHAQASHQRWQQPQNIRSANNGLSAWNNFHAVAAREDRAESEKFQRDLAASLEEEARTGIRRAPQYRFNETWKQVEIGDQSGDRQVSSVTKGSILPPAFPTGNSYGASATHLYGDRATNGLPIRGSKFFPTEARRAVTYSHPEIPRSPSPPPAEELGSLHPAYDGDAQRPVINFPVPKAVVKLPKPQERGSPTMPGPPAPPRTFAAAAAAQPPASQPSLRAVSQPLASTPDWQHRFNDLLGRRSPPKKQVLPVTSSSREPLDIVSRKVSAAVSLPPKEIKIFGDAGKITSKDVEEEEDLFEDREAASTPLVRVPTEVPENLWHPARTPQFRPKGRYFKAEVDPVSVSSFEVVDDTARASRGKEITLFVHLPGTRRSTKKTLSRKLINNGPGSKATKTHTFNNKHKKVLPKSRESSGSFPHIQPDNRGNSTRTPPTANGSIPTPRSGFAPNTSKGGWRENQFASAGMAH